MKRYVTGCKHFQDPVLETEYNIFASQSDNWENTITADALVACVTSHQWPC